MNRRKKKVSQLVYSDRCIIKFHIVVVGFFFHCKGEHGVRRSINNIEKSFGGLNAMFSLFFFVADAAAAVVVPHRQTRRQ